jgi:hypothetical protein
MVGTGLFDIFDSAIAEGLGVSLETYIDVIENKCSKDEAEEIIMAFFNEDETKIDGAKKLFNKYL